MNKVLLISSEAIGSKMAGPGIRYYNFAKELSDDLEVTLYIPNKSMDIDEKALNFTIIKGDYIKLIKECKTADSIVIQGKALRLYPFIKKKQKAYSGRPV